MLVEWKNICIVGNEAEGFAFEIPGQTGKFSLLSETKIRVQDCTKLSLRHQNIIGTAGNIGKIVVFGDVGYQIGFEIPKIGKSSAHDHFLSKRCMNGAVVSVVQ